MEKLLVDIRRRLDVLIGLSLQPMEPGKKKSLGQHVLLLSGLGFQPAEIAGILGKSGVHVRKELAVARKAAGRKKGGAK